MNDDFQVQQQLLSELDPGEKITWQGRPKRRLALSGGRLSKRPGVRKLVEGHYLILYRILPEKNTVRVLRFWHAARDRAGLDLRE
jgi:plasmid stabilization system protein ParE